MPIEVLIFDLDGVLADLCELHRDLYIESFNALATQPGVSGPLLSKELHNDKLEGLSTRSKLRACRTLFPAATYDEDAVYTQKQAMTMERLAVHHFPGRTREALEWAKGAGLRLACYTNSIRATLDLVLSRLGVSHLFEATQSNEEVPASKPSPLGYTQLMARLGVTPDVTAIFEDSPPGLAAARGSGAHVIQVLDSLDITPAFLQAAAANAAPYSPQRLNLVVPMAGEAVDFLVGGGSGSGSGNSGSSGGSGSSGSGGFTLPKVLLPSGVGDWPVWRLVVEALMPRCEPLRSATTVHLVVREEVEEAIKAAAPPGVHVHTVPTLTEGGACTVLSLRSLIDSDTPLFIANGDCAVEWDPDCVYRASFHPAYDGAVVAFYHPYAADLRWSYASMTPDGTLERIAEKEFVGPWATTGHYAWRRGSDFVRFAEDLIARDVRVKDQFFVAPSYALGRAEGRSYRVVPVEKYWNFGSVERFYTFLEGGVKGFQHLLLQGGAGGGGSSTGSGRGSSGSSGISIGEVLGQYHVSFPALRAFYQSQWSKYSHRLPRFNAHLLEDSAACPAVWGGGEGCFSLVPSALSKLRSALRPFSHKFYLYLPASLPPPPSSPTSSSSSLAASAQPASAAAAAAAAAAASLTWTEECVLTLPLLQMRAHSMPEVLALQSQVREPEMAAWAGAAQGAMAGLPPLSLTLIGLVPTRSGVSFVGYPQGGQGGGGGADSVDHFASVRAAIRGASPCWPGAEETVGYEVPFLRWTAQPTARELEGVMGVLRRFEGVILGTATPKVWTVGYATLSNRPPFTRPVHSWAAKE